jgi:soluble lytic murein transglycosylase-like protein
MRMHVPDLIGPLLCVLALSVHSGCRAQSSGPIYLLEDDVATIHLSDRAEGDHAHLLLNGGASAPLSPGAEQPPTPKALTVRGAIADIVVRAAGSNHLDPHLIEAVIAIESGHVARAVSPRGALGLMQLMPATARDYGVTDPFDAQQNVFAGARHLRRMLDQFGQNNESALAAYNAGAAAVAR